MWKYDRNNPDDPNNPFGRCYKPRFVYELHISPGTRNPKPEPTRKQTASTPIMVLPQAQVNIPLANSSISISVPGYIATCDLELDFQGSVKALKPISQANYQANQHRIYQGFKSDVAGFLEQIQILQSSIVKSALEGSQMTLDLPSNGYTSNTATISSSGVTVDSSTDTGDGSIGVSLSTSSPTTLVFHFDTVPITVQSYNSKFSGNLSMSLSVTLTPESGNTSNASSAFATAIANAEQKVSATAQGIVNDFDINSVIIIKAVALVVVGTFTAMVTLSSEIAPVVAGVGG